MNKILFRDRRQPSRREPEETSGKHERFILCQPRHTLSLMSTFIEDSSVAVDHDAHAAQLDLVDQTTTGDHDGIPVVHVTEPTSPVPPSNSPEPALLSRPSTANSLPEETHQQRRARYRSAVEVRQILFPFLIQLDLLQLDACLQSAIRLLY